MDRDLKVHETYLIRRQVADAEEWRSAARRRLLLTVESREDERQEDAKRTLEKEKRQGEAEEKLDDEMEEEMNRFPHQEEERKIEEKREEVREMLLHVQAERRISREEQEERKEGMRQEEEHSKPAYAVHTQTRRDRKHISKLARQEEASESSWAGMEMT